LRSGQGDSLALGQDVQLDGLQTEKLDMQWIMEAVTRLQHIDETGNKKAETTSFIAHTAITASLGFRKYLNYFNRL
jgi:hypothetical protein